MSLEPRSELPLPAPTPRWSEKSTQMGRDGVFGALDCWTVSKDIFRFSFGLLQELSKYLTLSHQPVQ